MTDFSIKRGDTEPAIQAQLQDDQGDPVDLTNADSVAFHMEGDRETDPAVDETASIDDAANGEVSYSWASGDTDDTGTYEAEFEVTYTDGGIETFPNDGFLEVVIRDDIA